MISKDSWYSMLEEAFEINGDDFSKMKTTLSEEELKIEFDTGYGSILGKPFTAWGEKYVYFPVGYDGSECVGYAPRNVCDIKTMHWGGY